MHTKLSTQEAAFRLKTSWLTSNLDEGDSTQSCTSTHSYEKSTVIRLSSSVLNRPEKHTENISPIQRLGGLTRYSINTCSRLASLPQFTLFSSSPANTTMSPHHGLTNLSVPDSTPLRGLNPSKRWIDQVHRKHLGTSWDTIQHEDAHKNIS